MRKLIVAGLAVAALLSVSVSSAGAQTAVVIGVGGGVAMPMGDFGDVAKMGYGAGAGLVVYPNGGNFGIRGDVGYLQFDNDLDIEGKFKTLTAMGNVLLRVPTEGSIAPYFLAGAGMLNLKFDDGDSESALAMQGGAGLSIGTGNARLWVEAKFVTSSKDGNRTSYVPLMAGVSFRP